MTRQRHDQALVGLSFSEHQAERERRGQREQQQHERDEGLPGREGDLVMRLIVDSVKFFHPFHPSPEHHCLTAAGGAAAFQFV